MLPVWSAMVMAPVETAPGVGVNVTSMSHWAPDGRLTPLHVLAVIVNGPLAVTLLFIPFNIGLGLRGPTGFHGAVVAASGDDARGAAIVVVAILVVAAAGTAVVAPFITFGLLPMALVSTVLVGSALAMLALLPTL